MKCCRILSTVLLLTLVFCYSCSSHVENQQQADSQANVDITGKNIVLDGFYTGLEEMCSMDSTGRKECYTDPARPERKWYHVGMLLIRGDSVFLDQRPISIGNENDTAWSASDGGFYFYSGTFVRTDTGVVFNLKEISCDYCATAVKMRRDGTTEPVENTRQLAGRIIEKGFIIKGYHYVRTKQEDARDKFILIR